MRRASRDVRTAAGRAVSALTVLARVTALAATATAVPTLAATAAAAITVAAKATAAAAVPTAPVAASGAASAVTPRVHAFHAFHAFHDSRARPRPDVRTPEVPGTHTRAGRADPGCQVHIGDVRVAAYRSDGHPIHAAGVGAYLACRLTVHNISLQVTLWKAGLLYDHEQAQTTARAPAGSHLGNDLTRVTCKDQTASRFYGIAHAIVYFGGRRGDAWVRSPGTSKPRCGT